LPRGDASAGEGGGFLLGFGSVVSLLSDVWVSELRKAPVASGGSLASLSGHANNFGNKSTSCNTFTSHIVFIFIYVPIAPNFGKACVLAPTLNANCDFTLIFFGKAFLPSLCENDAFVCPYSQHRWFNSD
jgi:hypothetical protein